MNWPGRRQQEDLSEEIRQHLAEKVDHLMRGGMRREDAERLARREFGNVTAVEELGGDVWRRRWLEETLADLRYALRQLRRTPAFTTAAVATLALGIGANSAIYSVIDAALFRPLPYHDPGHLVIAWAGEPAEVTFYSFSYPRFLFFRERASEFADLAAYDDEIVNFTDNSTNHFPKQGQPERLLGGRVSANFFSVLGVSPALGRAFLPEEDRHGAPPVAVIGDRFWRTRYHGDPGVLGRAVRVDADEFTIVGVLPPGFQFRNQPVDIWRTRMIDTRTYAPESVRLGASYLTIVGRLRTDLPIGQAQARLTAIDDSYKRDYPGNSDRSSKVYADLLAEQVFVTARRPLLLLWGTVVCLLIIACANVANLVLARASGRNREVAVRAALGAGKFRIARQLITEGLLLAFCGGVASLPVAAWSMQALVGSVRRTMAPIPDAHLDPRAMAITFSVAAAIGIVFGLAPVLILMRGGLENGLHSAGRALSASSWSIRLRKALVAGEVALCLVLVTAAALLAQGFLRMSSVETGVRGEDVVILPLDLMPDRYQSWESRGRFYDEVLRRAGAIPGAQEVAVTSRIDMVQRGLGYMVRVEGTADLGPANPIAHGRSVSPDYFATLGIPLLRGRTFGDRDSLATPRVMIVNEAFAKRFFPGRVPIGKHVTYSTDRIDCEIVGLVRDVRFPGNPGQAEPTIYLPLNQRPWLVAHLLVRTGKPAAVMAALRQEVQAVDAEQAVAETRLFTQAVSDTLGQPRTTLFVVTVFAGLAMLLATIGIYGVALYTVAQRSREIGIRMALGADDAKIRALVFRQSFQVLTTGLLVGVPLSAAASRFYAGLMVELRPADPATLAVVAFALGLVAVVASLIPAMQAVAIDPVASLRAE